MDTAEVFAPMRARLWQVVVTICALLFGSAACVGLVWWHQYASFYRLKYEAEEARTKLSAIVEFSEDAIISKSLDGIITSWNAGAEHIYGYGAAEAIGKPITILIPPEYPNELPQLTEKIKRGEAIKHYETDRIRKNGERIQMSLTLSPIKDESGAVVGISVIGRDITERKRAEEALNREQTLSATLMDNLPDAIYFKDTTSRFLRVNHALSRKFGLSEPAQLIGKSDADFFSGEHARQAMADEQEIIRTGRPLLNVEEKETWPDGTVGWVLTTKLPLRDAAGRVIGTCGISLDITERKNKEELILNLIEQQRVILDASPAMIFYKDKENRFIRVNETFAKISGLPREKIEGKTMWELYPKEIAEHYWQDDKEVIAAGKPVLNIIEQTKTSQGIAWVQTDKIPYRNSKGEIIGVIGFALDITERKAIEAQVKRLMADLERSNKELEQFASVASHDLQEPLRMISSYTQLLEKRYKGQLDDKAKKYITYAVDGAIRMQALINDLLTYSRIGTQGRLLELTDSHSALGGAIRNLAALIKEKRAIITNDNLPMVLADASQLILVFQNLLANAIKFRGKDIPRIHVSAQDHGREWVFSVKDNGIGIESQHAERVFVIFQRLHTREEYPGTGIGLAVCKQIVERHGGKIWFESEPGNGTTFFFTIPK
jgi:PAS domain S-box-containing protein